MRLDKVIEEAIANAQADQVAAGEEEFSEAERDLIGKQARFTQLTRAFHAPELAAEWR